MMTELQAWQHLAKAFAKPKQSGLATVAGGNSDHFLCCAIDGLYYRDLIYKQTKTAMKLKIEAYGKSVGKHRDQPIWDYGDVAGAKVRAAFCRKQVRLLQGGAK